MSIIETSYLFHLPVTLIALGLGMRDRAQNARIARWLLLGQAGIGLALVPWLGSGSEHLLWSLMVPLVALYSGMGILLMEPKTRRRNIWMMYGVLLVFALVPFFMAKPSPHRPAPLLTTLQEVAAWGLGGELPASLEPTSDTPAKRTVGHLPRSVTVSLHMTLLCSWLWIGLCLLRALTTLLPAMVIRGLPVVALLIFCFLPQLGQASGYRFDPGLFVPARESGTGVWLSDPTALLTYGPVLVSACILALAWIVRDAWPRRAATAS